jgi:cytochrome c oxidase cbb3-type subunit 3
MRGNGESDVRTYEVAGTRILSARDYVRLAHEAEARATEAATAAREAELIARRLWLSRVQGPAWQQAEHAALDAEAYAAGGAVVGAGLAGGVARGVQPSARGPAELEDHNYDGIQEYDNPTPGWWHLIFGGTAVFSVLYVLVFHFSGMVRPREDRLARSQEVMLERQFAGVGSEPNTGAKVAKLMQSPQWLETGASIFAGKCAMCHSADGSGLVGPNLTDEIYKNMASLDDMLVMIAEGKNAMPAQKTVLTQNDIAIVAAYVASLRGKNLPTNAAVSAELREGQAIEPWPTVDAEGTVSEGPAAMAGG